MELLLLLLADPVDDAFLILACDGVWDVLTDQEAADVALAAGPAACERDRAGQVVRAAYHKGSTDNISVVVVSIKSKSDK